MKIAGTALRLGAVSLVLLMFTAIIVVVFGQVRFDRTVGYSAIFSNASGLRAGQFVRAAGVEVGKVASVEPNAGGGVRVDFRVDRDLSLFDGTTAAIRYLNLIGDRYLEIERGLSNTLLPVGGTIPVNRTQPALDLDALIGSFRPLFRSLDPQRINSLADSLITVFQGEGGTINDILDQTAQLTSQVADSDREIGRVVDNLNVTLQTVGRHRAEFDRTLVDFDTLISGLKNQADPLAAATAHISDVSGTLADLLAENQSALHDTVGQLEAFQQPLVDQQDQVDKLLGQWPTALAKIARTGGVYGDFFNFYLCDLTLKLNGLQPGGPVRDVKIVSQSSGRCTPR